MGLCREPFAAWAWPGVYIVASARGQQTAAYNQLTALKAADKEKLRLDLPENLSW